MNNAARHGIGALIGVVAAPLIAGCLAYSVDDVRKSAAHALAAKANGLPAESAPSEDWAALAILLAGAAVIGLVVNARLPPLASLVPGVVISALGLAWFTETTWMLEHSTPEAVPEDFFLGYSNMAANGTFMIIGIALLVASVLPGRRRGTRPEPAVPAVPAAPKQARPDDDVIES
ncbi:hypothetical protein [Actinomadura bangladeshensis]|uniref:Uncharacterized protein n=1 Tax=Actinomadura bangladeshensis TaxID=453573 RepID=A0A4R4NXK1_9ACTN|nr:hypothetical protein [Actinomadura bangladeshensis]TDC12910.1 hypothetical protein E1284_21765 [Actinomadura bangladeshensis]